MSREDVLQRIRGRLGVTAGDSSRRERAMSRLGGHVPNTIPARARVTGAERILLFTEMLERVHGSVARVSQLDEVPGAVASYLGNGGNLCLTREVENMDLAWSRQAALRLLPWSARTSFDVCVTACVAAAAETGTLVVRSSPATPLTQHFLGDCHIVILEADNLFGAYEDVWEVVRGQMPRHLTFISGPSCTGDIEMIMEYGAHGPRNLHVILVDPSTGATPQGQPA